MARARNIKPGFFTNDLLAEINPLGRILFAGLWTIADREGRLLDRPKKIKAEVLPFDSCNIDKLLADLMKHGFIYRYSVNGVWYIQIVNWKKHQNPHIKEAESTVPAPCSTSTEQVQEQCRDKPNPERAGLIPDSLNLVAESIKTTPPTTAESIAQETDETPSSSSDLSRGKVLADRLAKWEGGRGKTFRFDAGHPWIQRWVQAGITDPQLREAYDMALTQREHDNDPTPVNVGFMDVFVAKLMNPPGESAVSGVVKAWHETASGIEAKGKELGIEPPSAATGGFPAFKAMVFRAAGMEMAEVAA